MSTAYDTFLASKRRDWTGVGFDPTSLPDGLYPFQESLTRWACRKGRASLWADTGLGKTRMQVAWAEQVCQHTGGNVLILAPLAVGWQTIAEAARIGITVHPARAAADVKPGITITNYEMLAHFDPAVFSGVVLDESSILKNFMGATKRRLIEAFRNTPYRLCCTATPAPNDHMELGNHAQFLGIMNSNEMISRWFINDPMEAGAYRLKGHGRTDFWRWLATWAMSLTHPSDLGFEDEGFQLPPLTPVYVSVPHVHVPAQNGMLFVQPDLSATSLHTVMRATAPYRAQRVAELIAKEPDETWLIWVNSDYEADAIRRLVPEAVEVRGSHALEAKEAALRGFAEGKIRVLVTKPSIAGFGMNWQHCARVAFLGLSYSYEQFYQAIRRVWRFGQVRPVVAYIVSAENEYAVLDTINKKQAAHVKLKAEMLAASREQAMSELSGNMRLTERHDVLSGHGDQWTLICGDSVRAIADVATDSIGYTIFSPPFSNLYIYSDALSDMGNAANHDEFFEHFGFLCRELHRVTQPGRLVSVHCKDLPLYKGRDGAAGLYDFPGHCIRTMESAGWTFHSRVTIWKDPVIEMQRTKNHGLLYKQLRKDSCASRQGMADYVVTFRKWIDAGLTAFPHPVPHDRDDFPLDQWQAWASPVWSDIRQTRVLQYRDAKGTEDERHICPLQLDVIERCIQLWSNPGDLVLSPFAGIGSEGYEAVRLGRRFLGFELKREYWEAAKKNLATVEGSVLAQGSLFSTRHVEDTA